jgi:hypothetical protein
MVGLAPAYYEIILASRWPAFAKRGLADPYDSSFADFTCEMKRRRACRERG